MKTILIKVPIRGNITQFELHRAIANREEYLEGYKTIIPEIKNPKPKYKIKESPALWVFLTGCLP